MTCHILGKKSAKRKRRLGQETVLPEADDEAREEAAGSEGRK